MPHAHRFIVRAATLALVLAVIVARPAGADQAADAEALVRKAEAYEARGTIETRRLAMNCLERATAMAPERGDYQVTLGRLYYRMGFLKQAKGRFQKAERLDPNNADARFGIGQVWRRDWLKYLDRTSLTRSIECFTAAARLRPGDCETWLQLVPMYYEQHDGAAAMASAESALASGPNRPEATLAVAYISYQLGRLGRAESSFVAALPRLPRLARERFEDIAPVASEQDTATLRRLPTAEKAEFVRRFWREHDPDLASRENEAQLEYWSRVAQAYFLYFDHKRREWDERGEVYVRYGPPERADYNPLGVPMAQVYTTGMSYPLNTLVWSYPSLGMQVAMQDRVLSEYYLLPVSMVQDMDPRPDPAVLAARGDLITSRGGRGVFPLLPPGAMPRPVDGLLVRFAGERGPRLMGQVQTQGRPEDTITAEWVVLDTAMVEVARSTQVASVSACDPSTLKVADFAAELRPGHYQVGMTVRDGLGGRGVYRSTIELGAAPATLTLSDAVVTCGRPDVVTAPGSTPSVRIEANPAAVVSGSGPLTVYFEMYDLRADESGTSRFEYECTVRSAERDPRIWIQRLFQPRPRIPEISASRREEQPGNLRRQFVTVPISELADGRYRLDIIVRDLNAGTAATTSVRFAKASAAPAGS